MNRILVINPGSTSTKLAIFEDENLIENKTIRHEPQELAKFESLYGQKGFRKKMIIEFLEKQGLEIADFDAFIGRGGLLKPIPGGTYTVTDKMLEDLKEARFGEHASNLGAVLANELASESKEEIPAYIADPVVVDEMNKIAKLSGHPDFERKSIFHALNQKAVAREIAARYGSNYESMNLVVVHMGGGISIGAHEKGKVVDVNNALNGDGPYTPERSGTLPISQFIELCYSGEYSYKDIKKLIKGNGGLVAYTGTNNCEKIQEKIAVDEDTEWALYYRGMVYQIVKWIGKISAALKGKVDVIVLTGGLAHDERFLVKWIKEKVSFIAPVEVVPGGDEERALAKAALRAIKHGIQPKIYEEIINV
ncbi:MAG: butyrate kinase [Kosmotogaceae bacterium]